MEFCAANDYCKFIEFFHTCFEHRHPVGLGVSVEGKSATAHWCESGGTCGAKCDGTEACVCVCARCAKGAVPGVYARFACVLSVVVCSGVVAIEATPLRIDRGVLRY